MTIPRSLCVLAAIPAMIGFSEPSSGAEGAGQPMVRLTTSAGPIDIELYADKAPETVANFLAYVEGGHYDGLLFHRVIPGFVIQGGGLEAGMRPRPTRDPIPNEADNGLRNETGTLSMARTGDPHSATSQFFINLSDNEFLDHRARSADGWGYAVFGRVVAGMEAVEAIAAAPTHNVGPHRDVPVEDALIVSAEVLPE
jgi:peptidyl-prolyl cis-trans isomerase B (cyclophilin B)